MAATSTASVNTRSHWAGSNADVDIHLEAYDGLIDGSFQVQSMFRSMGLTNFKSVAHQSNTWRGDRLGAVSVKGRKSGESVDPQRIATDKLIVTVDTTSYVRDSFDWNDDWTAPDFRAEKSAEHGTAHAKEFDLAHIIQLIKCATFVAPAHLKPAFKDGMSYTVTGYAAASDPEAKADLLVRQHKAAITEFVKRDQGTITDLITLVGPDEYGVLLDHKKLVNFDYQTGENNFVHRRIGMLNGVRVVETPRFPTAAISNHILGSQYNLSAAEAKAKMVVFNPKLALVTVEAQPMATQVFDFPKEFTTYMDSYTMYAVGQRRPDAVAVVFSD